MFVYDINAQTARLKIIQPNSFSQSSRQHDVNIAHTCCSTAPSGLHGEKAIFPTLFEQNSFGTTMSESVVDCIMLLFYRT